MSATSIIGNVSGKSTGATLSKVSGRKRWVVALAAAVLAIGSVNVRADDFFQWANPAVPAPYIKAPQLTDASLPTVLAYLSSAPPGTTLAVQVPNGATLSQTTINAVFNNYNIKYVFADYEGPTAISQTTTLVNQVSASTVTGPSFAANKSFVGNYFLGPITVDTTAPAGTTYNSGNSPVNPFPTATDFRNTGVNMATETLYPGDSSFRNPVNGNSTAPNIRSALFTLPIQRLSLATQNLGAGQANIPYISRFNNWSNGALGNGSVLNPVTGRTQNGFNTAGASINGQSVAGQLLSQNDFRALALHYRMRGATGFTLLDPGVIGYSQAAYQTDAVAGWNGVSTASGNAAGDTAATALASIYSGANARVATLPTVITFNGVRKTIEDAGVVYSAVTNDSAGVPGLAVLVSNLSNTNGSVAFNTRINGATLSYTTGTLTAGSHTLLRFTKSGGVWSSALSDPIFNDAALASRDGIGIPEPTSLSLLGIGALGILARRRRKA